MIRNKKYSNGLFLAIIAILTLSIYFPSLNNKFLNDWDDGVYVINNPQIKSLHSDSISYTLNKAFKSYTYGHYHPLTMLSYCMEYNLSGVNPKTYHITNLLLHILNAFLVFALVWLLVRQSLVAFITSLLFALHPMHVETVAWIADRKDLLCSLFFIAAMCSYVMYHQNQNKKYYILTFFLFVLALFSKAMAITFPVVLFALDYFMTGKISIKNSKGKLLFLILSLIFGYVSILAQKSNDALADLDHINILEKIMFSSYSIIMYVVKLFSFSNISAFYNYPLTENGKYPLFFYAAPFLLFGLIWVVLKIKQHKKLIRFGLAFFLITIALVLQIIPAGNVIMADRYTYLPYIGLFFIIAGFSNSIIANISLKSTSARPIVMASLVVYVFGCCYFSFGRTKVWNNSMSLWTDTIEKNPDAALPYCNRAALFLKQNQTEKAISDLNHAITIRPKYITAHYNRGIAFMRLGKFNEAVNDFSMVLQNKSRDIISVYMNRGDAYMQLGNYKEAIEDYTSGLSYDDHFGQAYYNRGLVFYTVNQYEEAIKDFSLAIRINPDNGQAYYLRAWSLYKISDFNHALEDANAAQKLRYPVKQSFINDILAKIKS
ncbi:MAG TPA: tetratricopeptide repeat protein [Bacteroidia bacterium]|jgi:tetratricopeptide (TPR) repeat protein|nr:tetratricopeptide repeat protein [Bacteroidia bacterium]